MVDLRGGRAKPGGVMDVFGLPELRGIRVEGDRLRIGSCVTNDELENSPAVNKFFPALSRCASLCGGPAIQNRATIGGNICTASGAGDLPVVLLALSAEVLLASSEGEEVRGLEDFVTGYRRTAIGPGQILKEVLIPLPAPGSRQAFFKRGSRKALSLSRVSLAAYAEFDGSKVRQLRLAAGSMSPVPRRLRETERALRGESFGEAFVQRASVLASEEISPRTQTAYRKNITGNLVRRFFEDILEDGA
jgi:carbon-monoxide dehydrogenase small subunit/xanthine dehydrogenase small subunit